MTDEIIAKLKHLAINVQDAYKQHPPGSFEVYRAVEDFRALATPPTVWRLCHHIQMQNACIEDLNEQIRELSK